MRQGTTPAVLALALALSIAGLAVGPALAALGRGRTLPSAVLEGLTLGLVPALVLVRIAPHVYTALGPLAIALLAMGYLALWGADRWGHTSGARLGRAVVVPTLALHALTDGAGLAVAVASYRGSNSAGALLLAALLVHRLPEGLFLATTLVPELGWRRTILRLGVIALATVIGATAGAALLARVPDALFDGAVALGLGAMLRLVVHSHSPLPRTRSARAASGVGFVLGLCAALAVPTPDDVLRRAQPQELSLIDSLGPLFIETAPALLAGLLAAGLLHAFLPRPVTGWLRGGTPVSQALRGMVFGLPLPLCSCGVMPLTRRMLLAGIPAAAVVAFAVGTPELGVDSALLSWRLLGLPLTVTRLVASAILAPSLALLVATAIPRMQHRAPSPRRFALAIPRARDPVNLPAPPSGTAARIRAAVTEALGPSLDHVAAWYLTGLVVAAIVEAALEPALATRLGAPLDVIASALLAVPLYVCAQGATPLAAVLVHKGFSVGAALAFLLVGPGTNVAVLGVLHRALGRRAVIAFAVGGLVFAIAAGLVANALVSPASVPAIHPLVAHAHSAFEWACAALLAALLLASLVRLGPRDWFAAMAVTGHDPAESAEHAASHGAPAPHAHAHAHAH